MVGGGWVGVLLAWPMSSLPCTATRSKQQRARSAARSASLLWPCGNTSSIVVAHMRAWKAGVGWCWCWW